MATIYQSGYVFKDDGTAVSGATVQLYQTDSTTLVTILEGGGGTSTTTNSDGYYSASVTEVSATSSYDVKITSGSSVRYRRGNDKLQLEELDIRNDTGATQGGLFVANTTNSASVKAATFAGMRTTANVADSDEVYISFELKNDAGQLEEFARITAEAVDVTDGEEDGQLRFGIAKTNGTIVDVFTVNSTTGGVTDMNLDVSGDITLDADGGDIVFKDGGTTFGSATNTSGNLIIKSGTTSALTFSGANVTLGGTATVTTITEVGSDTDKFLIEESSVIKYETGANIRSYIGAGTGDGDITAVSLTGDSGGALSVASGAAGFTLTGAAGIDTAGSGTTVTFTLDLNELTDTAIANGDYIIFTDATDSNATVKGDLADIATLFAGTGLTASSSVIGVDASQTQITAVGTIATGEWNGDAIASAYIAGDAITGAKIADNAIANEHLADDAVDSDEIAAGAIDNAHIADNAVGLDEMAGLVRGKLIVGDASGNPSALTVGSNTYVLTSDGTDATWQAAAAGGVSEANAVALILALG